MGEPSREYLRLRVGFRRPGWLVAAERCLCQLTAVWTMRGALLLGVGLGIAAVLVILSDWRWAVLLVICGGLATVLWAANHQHRVAAQGQPCSNSGHLEERNQQLQILLQANRAMAGELDLDRVLAAVVEQVTTMTGFPMALVALGPDQSGVFRVGASAGLTKQHLDEYSAILQGPERCHSPSEWVRQTLQPLVVEDVAQDFRLVSLGSTYAKDGIRSLITLPMVVQERMTGTLSVYMDRTAVFNTAQVSLLAALAAQAALAVENARLYTLMSESRLRLDHAIEFLDNASSALAHSQVGVEPLLKRVAGTAAKLFAPATVNLFVDAGNAHRGTPQRLTVHYGVDPVLAARYRECLMTSHGTDQEQIPWPAALSLPVILDGRRLGHFEIYLAGEGRSIEAEECRILQAFVHLAAGALANAGLVQDLRQAGVETERAYMGTLEALTRALEMRDHETEGHSRRVVQYTLTLAQKLGVPEEQLVPMMRGALLHDIGKIGVPDQILRKPGPLTPDEWEIMKCHTRIGYEILSPIDFLRDASPIILHHHERFDGSGYPDGLIGFVIPLGARIFAVADAYDALTSDRPYRRGRAHASAVEEIVRCSGTHFDPQVVTALLQTPEEELTRIRTGHMLTLA